jgi:hypothetical protein
MEVQNENWDKVSGVALGIRISPAKSVDATKRLFRNLWALV